MVKPMSNDKAKMPLRAKKKLQVEHDITHSALQLFEAKGYNSVSIDEIAEAANVSKGTFYNYFPVKEAVLLKLSQNSINTVKEAMSKSQASDNPVDMIRLCLHYLIDDIYLWRNVAREIATINITNESVSSLLYSLFIDYVIDAQKKGIFRNDYDCDVILRSVIGIYYIAVFWLNPATSKEEYLRQLDISYLFILEGILCDS